MNHKGLLLAGAGIAAAAGVYWWWFTTYPPAATAGDINGESNDNSATGWWNNMAGFMDVALANVFGGGNVTLDYGESFVGFIKQAEGFRAKPYLAVAGGNPTIGFGHEIQDDESYLNSGLTQQGADALLRQDLNVRSKAVAGGVSASINRAQFECLLDVRFNTSNATYGPLLRAVNAGNIAGATQQLIANAHWNAARGASGLLRRRALEIAALNSSGDFEWPTNSADYADMADSYRARWGLL